jgi:hypothetical protein
MELSWAGILDLGFRQDPISETGAEESRRVEVYLPSQDPRELLFHGKQSEAGNVAGLEFDEHVHIAVRSEITP